MARRKTKVRIPRPEWKKRKRKEPDKSGRIAKEMMRLCNAIGFPIAEAYRHWAQLALEREYWLGVPQEAAEEAAWRDLRWCLDKRDTQQENAS